MADLIVEGARTLTFVRSRRGAELTALGARARLAEVAPELAALVSSYRAGYLAEDRRALEQALVDGGLRAWRPRMPSSWVSTSPDWTPWCWPGSRQRVVVLAAGRPVRASRPGCAGGTHRAGRPLDTYLVHHPSALLDEPVERVVIDPANPVRDGTQLLCAATELPMGKPRSHCGRPTEVAASLIDDGLLRRRGGSITRESGVDPHPAVDIQGSAGGQVAILETDTGRLLGGVGRAGPGDGAPGCGVPASG